MDVARENYISCIFVSKCHLFKVSFKKKKKVSIFDRKLGCTY